MSNLAAVLKKDYGAVEANSYDKNQLRINCPYCHLNNHSLDTGKKVYIHLKNGLFFCQRCRTSGSLAKILKDAYNIDMDDLGSSLRKFIPVEDMKKHMLNTMYPQKTKIAINKLKLPKEYTPLDVNSDEIENILAFQYLFDRGFPLEDILDYQIGYCKTGYYAGRLIIPCFENDEIVYFTNRLFLWGGALLDEMKSIMVDNMGIPKTINHPKEDKKGNVFIGKSEVLFNIDRAAKGKVAVITEGWADAFKVGDSGVGILGSAISNIQLHKIISKRFEKVVLMLDPDTWEDGKSAKAIEQLYRVVPLHVVKLTPYEGDPGQHTREELKELVDKSKPFNNLKFKLTGEVCGETR